MLVEEDGFRHISGDADGKAPALGDIALANTALLGQYRRPEVNIEELNKTDGEQKSPDGNEELAGSPKGNDPNVVPSLAKLKGALTPSGAGPALSIVSARGYCVVDAGAYLPLEDIRGTAYCL